MMASWKQFQIGDVVDIKHGFAFKGAFFSDEPTDDVLLTPGNFKIGGGFKGDKFKYYAGDYPEEYILNHDDIIVTMTDLSKNGDTLGYPAKIPVFAGKKFLHNQRLGLLTFKSNIVDKDFLYWIMRDRSYQRFIVNSASGSTVKHTSPTRIKEYSFKAPSNISEQKQIAKILSDLDDKIELNSRMNKTLEAMGQALFKHWFIDFEFPWDFKNNKFDPSGKPYKSSGGKMVPSSLGPIPSGWRVGCLGDFGKIQPGYAFKSKDFIESGVKVIKIRNIQNSIIDITDTDCVNESVFQSTDEKFYLCTGDILIAMTGAELGKVGIVPQVDSPMLLNQRVGKVQSTYPFLCYLILKGNVAQSFMKGVSSASSAQGNISNTDIEDIKLVVGADDVIMHFAEITNPLFLQLVQNLGESIKLAQTRNSLLPKFMSGKLKI